MLKLPAVITSFLLFSSVLNIGDSSVMNSVSSLGGQCKLPIFNGLFSFTHIIGIWAHVSHLLIIGILIIFKKTRLCNFLQRSINVVLVLCIGIYWLETCFHFIEH